MAKVRGPLLSLEASQSLGGVLTFQKRKSGIVVYKKTSPGDIQPFTPSSYQNTQRALIGGYVRAWQALNPSEKAIWNQNSALAGFFGAGYHYYLHKNCKTILEETFFILTEDEKAIITENGNNLIIE